MEFDSYVIGWDRIEDGKRNKLNYLGYLREECMNEVFGLGN